MFERDFLLTVTSYWVSQTITTSMRDYVDNRALSDQLPVDDRVLVPTAITVFANQLIDDGSPPLKWAQRLYNVRRWTPMSQGGHFPAVEKPEPLSRALAEFSHGA